MHSGHVLPAAHASPTHATEQGTLLPHVTASHACFDPWHDMQSGAFPDSITSSSQVSTPPLQATVHDVARVQSTAIVLHASTPVHST